MYRALTCKHCCQRVCDDVLHKVGALHALLHNSAEGGPGLAALSAPKSLQPALASSVAGVEAAPLPDTGAGSVGAKQALLPERTLGAGGPHALSHLVPFGSILPPPLPPPPPAVSDSSDESARQRKKRNLGLGNGASAVVGVADAAIAAP